MNDIVEAKAVAEIVEENPRKTVVVIKIANGYIVGPDMYCGDIEKVYAADVDGALAKAKEFLA